MRLVWGDANSQLESRETRRVKGPSQDVLVPTRIFSKLFSGLTGLFGCLSGSARVLLAQRFAFVLFLFLFMKNFWGSFEFIVM